MNPSSPLALVSLKAFGDFIIARWALERHAGDRPVSLLAGAHLAELGAALGSDAATRWVAHGESDVPALFDIRRRGWRRAAQSAWRLRRAIAELEMGSGTTMVFDKVGARESFVAGRSPVAALPVADNIYHAYGKLLALSPRESALARDRAPRSSVSPVVGIFPGSRIAAKVLPPELIARLAKECLAHGVEPLVFRLEGEATGPLASMSGVRTVPRRFAAMADAVRSVDAVVSADSMPAHMAEFFGVPVFVCSPVPNRYWLPLSCFDSERWSLFDDAMPVAAMDFLDRVSASGSRRFHS